MIILMRPGASSAEIEYVAARVREVDLEPHVIYGPDRKVITVVGDRLNNLGILIDFGELKQACSEVIAPLDHSFLNELPAFADTNPPAEAIARHLYQGIRAALHPEQPTAIHVARVTVYESDRSAATYQE